MQRVTCLGVSFVWVLIVNLAVSAERIKLAVPSSVDGVEQTCYLNLPDRAENDTAPRPLMVLLHSWSGNVEQRNPEFEQAALRRGWFCLQPDFRGQNHRPEACGSPLAQQDVIDAVRWVVQRWSVDRRRIYVTGSSGGGHMTLMMAGRHPQVWAAASAWVPISNMSSWHARHAGDRYGQMMRQACGGAPGASAAVDAEYQQRSPLTHLARAGAVPLEIAAGVHDGHQGSVPVRHTLDAFNVLARVAKTPEITAAEIDQISQPHGRLEAPQPGDSVIDPSYARPIYLRRVAGLGRVTIFEGGHEGLGEAACSFLERFTRPTDAPLGEQATK